MRAPRPSQTRGASRFSGVGLARDVFLKLFVSEEPGTAVESALDASYPLLCSKFVDRDADFASSFLLVVNAASRLCGLESRDAFAQFVDYCLVHVRRSVARACA